MEQPVTCTVAAARPKATISWYLGSEEITFSSKSESTLNDPNVSSKFIQRNWNLSFQSKNV